MIGTNGGDLAARNEQRARWRAEGWYSDLAVGAAMARASDLVGDTSLVFATKTSQAEVSLTTVYRRASRVAGGLLADGLQPGDRVVVKAPASYDATVAVAALWLAGAVVVPVVPFATPSEVDAIVRRSDAAGVLEPDDLASLERAVDGALPLIDPSTVACIIYTSGSTA